MQKVTVHLLLEEMHGWILTKLGRNHPQGPGIQRCSYGTCGHHGGQGFKGVHMVHVATMGARGRAPKGQIFANFKLLLQIQLK